MPCKAGYRQSLEESKRRAVEEREALRSDPFRKLWVSLVARENGSPNGFDSLTEPERLYYSVGLLELEVYNGGFDQYFFNSSSSYYAHAEAGLALLGAAQALQLLRQAKEELFPAAAVPEDTKARRQALRVPRSPELDSKLSGLDRQYWADPDGLEPRLQAFAREHGLVP